MSYPKALRDEARRVLLEQYDIMCEQDFGKIEVNMNRHAATIEIVPSPHFRFTTRNIPQGPIPKLEPMENLKKRLDK